MAAAAAAAESDRAGVLEDVARALAERGDAVAAESAAARIEDPDGRLWGDLAVAEGLLDAGDRTGAIAALRRVAAPGALVPPIEIPLDVLRHAVTAYARAGAADDAVIVGQGFDYSPTRAAAFRDAASAAHADGRTEAARRMLEAAVWSAHGIVDLPEYAAVMRGLAPVQARIGDADGARAALAVLDPATRTEALLEIAFPD